MHKFIFYYIYPIYLNKDTELAMNIDQIRKHIDSLIKEKHKNYRALSLAIGKNEAYLHQYINKGSPLRLPEKERRKLATLLDVDEQELTDITLPKAAGTHKNSALIELLSNEKNQSKTCETVGFISLPITDFSRLTSSSPQNIKMIRVSGDSMYPTLKDGDYVFFDESLSTYTFDGLYIVDLPNGWQVRRIQQVSSSEYAIILDNTNYQSSTCNFKKLQIIGKVISAFKTEKLI